MVIGQPAPHRSEVEVTGLADKPQREQAASADHSQQVIRDRHIVEREALPELNSTVTVSRGLQGEVGARRQPNGVANGAAKQRHLQPYALGQQQPKRGGRRLVQRTPLGAAVAIAVASSAGPQGAQLAQPLGESRIERRVSVVSRSPPDRVPTGPSAPGSLLTGRAGDGPV